MNEPSKYDHIRKGPQSLYYVYPPSSLTEVTGFEDGLPEICLEKIRRLLPRCRELKARRDSWIKLIKRLNKPNSLEETCQKVWAASEYSEYYVIQKWLNHWTKLWRAATNKPLPRKLARELNRIDDRDIERARLCPIEALYQGRLRRVGNKLMGLCPFHEEKTSSFCIYPDGKGYHCFGCQANGGAIDFVMKTKGYSFPEAVRSLL